MSKIQPPQPTIVRCNNGPQSQPQSGIVICNNGPRNQPQSGIITTPKPQETRTLNLPIRSVF